ncbi:MAG: HypC/HybG/HupF family hydrogenase formation chaperone [bacterium]|nr:HypC/HybG/HupF family hydrogenase formation chaperone [bacterium]
MCLAIPLKIEKIRETKALVSGGDHKHWVDLSLLENPKVGEWIISYQNVAINKIAPEEAEKISALQKA